jgi:hypothetical protein
MNHLKKKAKQEFIGTCLLMALITPCLIKFVNSNTQGFVYILMLVVVGIPAGLYTYLRGERQLKSLDERQNAIYQYANGWALNSVIFYQLAFAWVVFFFIGGQGKIPVWLMPMMLFTALFLGQTVKSFILFWKCEKEDDE